MAPAAESSPSELILDRLDKVRDAYLNHRLHAEPAEALTQAIASVFESPDIELVNAFLSGEVLSNQGDDGLQFRTELMSQLERFRTRLLEREQTAEISSSD